MSTKGSYYGATPRGDFPEQLEGMELSFEVDVTSTILIMFTVETSSYAGITALYVKVDSETLTRVITRIEQDIVHVHATTSVEPEMVHIVSVCGFISRTETYPPQGWISMWELTVQIFPA